MKVVLVVVLCSVSLAIACTEVCAYDGLYPVTVDWGPATNSFGEPVDPEPCSGHSGGINITSASPGTSNHAQVTADAYCSGSAGCLPLYTDWAFHFENYAQGVATFDVTDPGGGIADYRIELSALGHGEMTAISGPPPMSGNYTPHGKWQLCGYLSCETPWETYTLTTANPEHEVPLTTWRISTGPRAVGPGIWTFAVGAEASTRVQKNSPTVWVTGNTCSVAEAQVLYTTLEP